MHVHERACRVAAGQMAHPLGAATARIGRASMISSWDRYIRAPYACTTSSSWIRHRCIASSWTSRMHANLKLVASRCRGSCTAEPIHIVNCDGAKVALQLRDLEAMPIPALTGPPAEVGCIAMHCIGGDPWHLLLLDRPKKTVLIPALYSGGRLEALPGKLRCGAQPH